MNPSGNFHDLSVKTVKKWKSFWYSQIHNKNSHQLTEFFFKCTYVNSMKCFKMWGENSNLINLKLKRLASGQKHAVVFPEWVLRLVGGAQITLTVSLTKEHSPLQKRGCPMHSTKRNLIVRLQFWRSEGW